MRGSAGLPSFLVFGLLLAAAPASQGPEILRFETEIGPVTMNHGEHQRAWTEDCAVCHHQAEEGPKQPCGRCHKGRVEAEEEGGAPAYFDAKMKLCRGCHLEKRERNGASKAPIHCAECHDIREKAKEEGQASSSSKRTEGRRTKRKGWIK